MEKRLAQINIQPIAKIPRSIFRKVILFMLYIGAKTLSPTKLETLLFEMMNIYIRIISVNKDMLDKHTEAFCTLYDMQRTYNKGLDYARN